MTSMGADAPPSADLPQRGGFLGTTGSTGRASPRFELTLAVLGAVCSAVATGVLDQLEVSATGKLIGLAVGAALPPFVAVAGRWQHVRVAATLFMTVPALVLSYGGWQVFANVSGTEPVVPTPQQVIDRLIPRYDPDVLPPADAIEMWEGELGIRVSPGSITCDESGACNGVTVTSIGTGLLAIRGLELEDEGVTTLQASGCEDAQLTQGGSCIIALAFTEGGPQESLSTRLVIHQNFEGPATKVPLVAESEDGLSSNIAVGKAVCSVPGGDADADTGEVTGVLAIDVPLSWEGTSDPPEVTATVEVNGLPWTSSNADTAAGTLHVSDEYEGPRPSEIRITVDSASQFAESDEGDNTAIC
jgi:hypothetical protein